MWRWTAAGCSDSGGAGETAGQAAGLREAWADPSAVRKSVKKRRM